MPGMKTAVRGGLLLISAGAGAAAVNAYYRAKYPADPSPAVSRLLHNEVRRAQLMRLSATSSCYLPTGNFAKNIDIAGVQTLYSCAANDAQTLAGPHRFLPDRISCST